MIHNVIAISTPFLLASIGGLLTELSGSLNIALEGLALFGAFFAIVGAYLTGNLFAGIVAAIVASTLLAALFAFLSIGLKSNYFIVGLGVNLLASGAAAFFSLWIFGAKGVIRLPNNLSLGNVKIPLIDKIPVLGEILSGHTAITYLSWLVLIAAVVLIYKTNFGLELRASGYYPQALRSKGLDPDKYKVIATLISGGTCGLAGAQLSLTLGSWVPNITSGRGWIALVAIYLGMKRPLGAAGACLIFAAAEYFAISMQGVLPLPASVALTFPYLVTLIALVVITVGRRRSGR